MTDLPDFLKSKTSDVVLIPTLPTPLDRPLTWQDIVISQEKLLDTDMWYLELTCVHRDRCDHRCSWSFSRRTALPFADGVRFAKKFCSLCERREKPVRKKQSGQQGLISGAGEV